MDSDFAPKGYHAKPCTDGCTGCAFEPEEYCGKDKPCCVHERPDKCDVIFVANCKVIVDSDSAEVVESLARVFKSDDKTPG